MLICMENVLATGERRDQHQQRRFRQMEVGEKTSNDTKFKSWVDEKIRLARARLNLPVALPGRVFESPDRRGAYGHDAPPLGQCAVELCGDRFRNVEAFAMHFVVFQ